MSARCFLLLALVLPALAGCGQDFRKEVAYVSGTVTCGGEPVTEGYVLFTPVVPSGIDPRDSGKSATGQINPDGTFVMGTYDEEDGALVGDHEVHVYRPDPEDDESPEAMAYQRNPYACGAKVIRVTVETGSNVIDIDPGV